MALSHTFVLNLKLERLCLAKKTLEVYFASKGVLTNYQREMSWRILKNKQDLVLNSHQHNEFMNIYPQSHKYIMSCPVSFCNRKIKIFMWMLTHYLRWPLLGILYLRKIIGR